MSRDVLIKINYFLVAFLLIGASLIVMHFESPEKLIQGEWVEKEWRLEKEDLHGTDDLQIQAALRKEILRNVEDLHLGIWKFYENGTLRSTTPEQGSEIEWFIKGRGHVLELRREGKQIESFQIQQISKDRLVLHLNFDLQVKGIIEIVLERKERGEQYAEKV